MSITGPALRITFLALVGLLVGACVAEGTGPTTTPATAPEQSKVILPARTVGETFERICLETAPSFASASGRMSKYGLSRRARTGTVYHVTGSVSVKIQDVKLKSGAAMRQCSLVFETPDKDGMKAEVDRLLELLGPALRNRKPQRSESGQIIWPVRLGGRGGFFGFTEYGLLRDGKPLPVGSLRLLLTIDTPSA